jgi:two-component system chemotaxis response regulator CheY
MAYNVLVVDDSRVIRAVIKKTLGLAGIPINELYEAQNGKEALGILREKKVDLVFSDIHMPEMTGVEMVEQMAADGALKDIPVIVVSSEGSQTRLGELLDKGARAYVRKPFTPELIRDVVRDTMEKSHG